MVCFDINNYEKDNKLSKKVLGSFESSASNVFLAIKKLQRSLGRDHSLKNSLREIIGAYLNTIFI